MKHVLLLATFMLTFVVSSPLPAQTGDWVGRFSLQLLGGIHKPMGAWGDRVDMGPAYGGKLSYHISDMWVSDITLVQGGYADIAGSQRSYLDPVDGSIVEGSDLVEKRASYLSFNQARYLMRGSLRPYVAAGLGVYRESIHYRDDIPMYNSIDHTDHNHALGFNLGMGVEKRINTMFSIAIDARYHKAPNALDLMTVNAGVNVASPDAKPLFHWIRQHHVSRFSVQLGGGATMPIGKWADGANFGGLAGGSIQYDMLNRYSIALTGFYSPRIQTDSWNISTTQEYSGAAGGLVVGANDVTLRQYLSHYYLSLDHIVYLSRSKVSPYVMLGTGYYEYRNISESAESNPRGGLAYSESDEELGHIGMSAGLGLDIRIHPMASLVGGVRYHFALNNRPDDHDMKMVSIKAGMNFYMN